MNIDSENNLQVFFCGISKNCIETIKPNIIFLKKFVENSKFNSQIIIVDSDSTDGTKEVLEQESQKSKDLIFINYDGLENLFPNRIERIARSRNKCLDVLKDNTISSDIIYIPLDLDIDLFRFTDFEKFSKLIQTCVSKNKNYGIFPFSTPYYYDIFALRATKWVNYNSIFVANKLKKFLKLGSFLFNYPLIFKHQISIEKFISKKSKVRSAFGGIGIYFRKDGFQNVFYSISDKYPHDVSEHVIFNQTYFNEIDILSTWLVPAPDEHLVFRALSFKGKIIYFIKSIFFDFSPEIIVWIVDVGLFIKSLLLKLFKIKYIWFEKTVLITASDSKHFIYLENLINNFEKYYKFKLISNFIIYDLGLTKSEVDKINSNKNIVLKKFNFENYPKHFSKRLVAHSNKIGGFAWKPAIIKEVVNEFKCKTIWFDSANLFNLRLIIFKVLIDLNGFASFYSSGTINEWTHANVLKDLRLKENKKLLQSKNLMGGVIGIDPKNQYALNLLNQWEMLAKEEKNIFPINSNTNNHRHDQSLLSIKYWLIFDNQLPSKTNLFGVTVQNWKNKILFFYDDKYNLRETLLKKYYFQSTTTNKRCKIIILFNASSLTKIPFSLLLTKRVLLFLDDYENMKELNFHRFKKYFVKKIIKTDLLKQFITVKHYLSYNSLNDLELIINEEYKKFFNE